MECGREVKVSTVINTKGSLRTTKRRDMEYIVGNLGIYIKASTTVI